MDEGRRIIGIALISLAVLSLIAVCFGYFLVALDVYGSDVVFEFIANVLIMTIPFVIILISFFALIVGVSLLAYDSCEW